MKDIADTLTKPIVNFLGAHPVLMLWVIGVIAGSLCITNGLRIAFPDKKTAPRWVEFLIGACDPLTGNVWRILEKMGFGAGRAPEQKSGSYPPGQLPAPVDVSRAEPDKK